MVNYSSKLIKGAGIIFLMSILSSAFGYLIRILLAKKLTIEEFGLFFAVYSIVLLIGTIKGFGTDSALQKFIPEYQIKNEGGNIKSVLVFISIFSLLGSLLFLFLIYLLPAGIINTYFKSNLAKSLLLLLFIFVSIDSLSKLISGFFLTKHFSFLFSLRDLVIKISIIIFLLLLNEINVLGASLIHIAAVLSGLIINFIFFFRHFTFFNYKCKITKVLAKKIFKFGVPLITKDVFGFFMSRIDNLVLVYFRPLAEVAIYNAILPTVELLLLFGRPFSRVLFPLTSELWALNKRKEILHLLKMIHKYVFVLSIPLGISIYFFSKFILKILFGTEYVFGSFGMKILTIGFLIAGITMTSNSILKGIGKPNDVAKISIIRNIINFFLNIILIPLFGTLFDQGFLGAIISTTFCFFVSFLLLSYYLHKHVNYQHPFKDFFYILLSGFLASTIGYVFIKNIFNIYIQIGTFILLLVLSYPLFLFMFNVISKKEIKGLLNLLKKKTA